MLQRKTIKGPHYRNDVGLNTTPNQALIDRSDRFQASHREYPIDQLSVIVKMETAIKSLDEDLGGGKEDDAKLKILEGITTLLEMTDTKDYECLELIRDAIRRMLVGNRSTSLGVMLQMAAGEIDSHIRAGRQSVNDV